MRPPTKGNTMSEKNITNVDAAEENVIITPSRFSNFKASAKKNAPKIAIPIIVGASLGVLLLVVDKFFEDKTVEIKITDSGYTVTEVTPED